MKCSSPIQAGILPVKALSQDILNCFEKFGNNGTDFEHELKYNGLKKRIIYKITDTKIEDCACLNDHQQIEVYETFCQYVWSLAYSILVVFDEAFMKPIVARTYNGIIDDHNPLIREALDSLNASIKLFSEFNRSDFYKLPNPESPESRNNYYVGKTNSVLCTGMSFILLHEFAHQFYGHFNYDVDGEESKREEAQADEYAYDILSQHFGSETGRTIQIGIIIGLVSLLFMDNTMLGGNQHPDPDDRLRTILDKMDLSDDDNLWGLLAVAINLWAIVYHIPFLIPDNISSFKDWCEHSFVQIEKYKKKSL